MNALAIDLGGRRIKLGLVSSEGQLLACDILPALSDRPLAHRLPDIALRLRALCDAQHVEPSSFTGIAMSYPSVIEPGTGRILDEFGKFGNVQTADLRRWADREFNLPLAIDNDARMALLGEWQHGAGRGGHDLVMMTLGTGIGTAALISGKLLRGRHGQAAILGGHLTVHVAGRPCVCGNIGCAEAEASTSVLAQLVAEAGLEATAGEPASYEAIFRLAAAGNPRALAIQTCSLEVWGATAVNLIHAFDPSRLIVGGGVMGSRDVVLPAIAAHVARHAHTPWGQVEVVASELGDHAALLAAPWLIEEQLAASRY